MQAAQRPVIRTVATPELVEHLDRLAHRNGLSRSSQVRTTLLDALHRDLREGYGDLLPEVPPDAA